MGGISVRIHRLPHGRDLPLPHYASAGAAGMDLSAALPPGQTLSLAPGERARVPTGFVFALPPGYEAQIRPRSGLAHHHGLTLVNAPGTIDSDYHGEILILLINLGKKAFTIKRGMRIAQAVFAPAPQICLREGAISSSFFDGIRGDGGFGSTGLDAAARKEES